MLFSVTAWMVDDGPDDEEPHVEDERSAEFPDQETAARWCWDRMEEGYATRLWRR